jgi:hypothetical protein
MQDERIAVGLCQCGCGERAPIATQTWGSQYRKGDPMRFISGHNVRRTMPLDESYVSEDRGHETPCWIWQRQKNPAHMEPVSPAENVRRSRVAKLTLDGARDIRRRSSAGESQYALAAEYGVTQATISSVTRGLTWREGL